MAPNTSPNSSNRPDRSGLTTDVISPRRSFESADGDTVLQNAEPHPPKTITQPTNGSTGHGGDDRDLDNSGDRSHTIQESPTTTVPAVLSEIEFVHNLLQISTTGGRDNGAGFTRRGQGSLSRAVASVQRYNEDIRNFKHLPVPGSDPPEQPHEMPGIYPDYLHDAMGMSGVGGYCPHRMAIPEEFESDLDLEGGLTAQDTDNDPFLGYGLPFLSHEPGIPRLEFDRRAEEFISESNAPGQIAHASPTCLSTQSARDIVAQFERL